MHLFVLSSDPTDCSQIDAPIATTSIADRDRNPPSWSFLARRAPDAQVFFTPFGTVLMPARAMAPDQTGYRLFENNPHAPFQSHWPVSCLPDDTIGFKRSRSYCRLALAIRIG